MDLRARASRNLVDVARAVRGDRRDRQRLARRYLYDAVGCVSPFVGMNGEHGIVFAGGRDRTVGREVFVSGDWDTGGLERAVDLAGVDLTGAVLVEVGANIGTTTLAAARLARRVVAFEPAPLNYRLLRANMAVNLVDDRVTCVDAACSAAAGTGKLALNESNWGDHRMSASGQVEVRTARLDGELSRLGIETQDVGFIWIDVQGHEGSVLTGAPELLAAGPPLVIEFWPELLGQSVGVVEDLVDRHYDRVVDLADGAETTIREQTRRWPHGGTDLLCTRTSRTPVVTS